MDNLSQNTSPSSNAEQFFGFVGLLAFAAVALYGIGPEVIADTFRKASGGLTTAEQVQLAARQEFERLEAERLRNIEIAQQERQKLEEQQQANRRILGENERTQYLSARGDLERLRRYLRDCVICAYQTVARDETGRLETEQKQKQQQQTERRALEDKERSQYLFALGDLERLRLYLRDCVICEHQTAARGETSRLEAEEQARRSPAVTFRLKSNHPNAVLYAFYSRVNRSRVWPGGVLADSAVHTERLSCEPGEMVCYGAWVQGAFPSPSWGVGAKGKQSCTNCCFTCPTLDSNVITLEPRDAQTPLPDVTWNVSKNFGGALALSFYSTLRQNHSWPGSDRVYLLNDQSSHQYGLNCIAGEKICYGAWFSGNPDGTYWGAGPGGRHSCVSCCSVCDGGEYTANLIFQSE
jgi:hypothetical protein